MEIDQHLEHKLEQVYQQLVLLENVRFYAGEEGCKIKEGVKQKLDDEEVIEFREKLSKLGDIYINDAYGTIHRDHSSIIGIECEYRVTGFLMKKEIEYLV